MNKIAIIGLPGSGKSTFALSLSKKLNLPVFYLDSYMFVQGTNGIKKDKKEFAKIEEALVDQEKWIIEGCSLSTLETRFQKADLVIYLKPSRLTCIFRLFKRALFSKKILKGTGCYFGINLRIIKYLWTFEKEKGPSIYNLAKKYPQTKFRVIQSVEDLIFNDIL